MTIGIISTLSYLEISQGIIKSMDRYNTVNQKSASHWLGGRSALYPELVTRGLFIA